MMKSITDQARLEEIFARGTVVDVLPGRAELMKKLLSGERLKIYIGFDPTFTSLHLGHAKNIMFLEELRQLGHEVIVLFGDFTALIGDPDKNATRKQLTPAEVKHNVSDWLRQIRPLIDFDDKANPAQIKYNSEWLTKLSFAEVLDLAANFTVQQMLERDLFAKRIKAGNPVHLHEFLYPLMQGYDSVAMDVDVELCATDQIFNALAGRTLLKRLKHKDKFVIALNLLANPETGELMSKSTGTGVFIGQPANDLFGAVMALPDAMISPLYLNCTRLPLSERDALTKKGPRQAKARVAFDIVKRFHGEKTAQAAEESFDRTFSKGGVPEDVQEISLVAGEPVSETLIKVGIIASKSEWRRLIEGGGIRDEDDSKITDPNYSPSETTVLKIGKRRFVKLVKL
ncbi:MAG: tyrosyl-tRNA synthetase [Candidatus Parcubacteria bacterium]|jgi:tyrosyl-tRNA synthetase|nr:tyrosyl-tRNA synthetase [Candidatus Parcubacteria bacterium]